LFNFTKIAYLIGELWRDLIRFIENLALACFLDHLK